MKRFKGIEKIIIPGRSQYEKQCIDCVDCLWMNEESDVNNFKDTAEMKGD